MFVALMIGSTLLSGVVSAANINRNLDLKPVVAPNNDDGTIEIVVIDENNLYGYVGDFHIKIRSLTSGVVLVDKDYRGKVSNGEIDCPIDKNKLTPGLHTLDVIVTDLTGRETNFRNNAARTTFYKKQDLYVSKPSIVYAIENGRTVATVSTFVGSYDTLPRDVLLEIFCTGKDGKRFKAYSIKYSSMSKGQKIEKKFAVGPISNKFEVIASSPHKDPVMSNNAKSTTKRV